MAKSEIVVESRQRQLEAIISKALQSYTVVGKALAELKTIVPYGSFEARCQELWEMSPRYLRNQMQAAEVSVILERRNCAVPATESQARELVPLLPQPELMSKTWIEVVGTGEKITAATIKIAVAKALAPEDEDEDEDEVEDSEEEDDTEDDSETEEDEEDEEESEEDESDPEDEDDDYYDDDTTPFKKACKSLSNKYHAAGLSLLEASKMCDDERDVEFVSTMIDVLIIQLEDIKKNLKAK